MTNHGYFIKHKIRFLVAFFTIAISMYFFLGGFTSLAISEIFKEGYELQETIIELNYVSINENPDSKWLEEVLIEKTNDNPLEIHKKITFYSFISTKIIPEELVIHIFHEDMSDFFVRQDNSTFQKISFELDRIPTLRYGDVFNIQFDVSDNLQKETVSNYGFNENETVAFKKPGSYFALVSIKTKNGEILHHKITSSIMEIRDPNVGYVTRSLDKLLISAEEQKVTSIRSFGLTFIAIGTGMLFSGTNLIMTTIEKKIKRPFYR